MSELRVVGFEKIELSLAAPQQASFLKQIYYNFEMII